MENDLADVQQIMRERAIGDVERSPGTFPGSTGDIVLRLRELGIYTHKARVGEVADMLFGDAARPHDGGHRRISDEQFEVMCRAFVLCAAYGYTMEEIADFIHGRMTKLKLRAHLERGVALIDALEEYAGMVDLTAEKASAG